MAHTFMIFDYGVNEEEAQDALHTLESWKQAFRLDKKLLVKFDRSEEATEDGAGGNDDSEKKADPAEKPSASGKKSKSKKAKAATEGGSVRLLVRLDFSDHEKLSYQRWLDRVPADEHFKNASPRIIRSGEPEFAKTAKLFDSLG